MPEKYHLLLPLALLLVLRTCANTYVQQYTCDIFWYTALYYGDNHS